MYREDDITMYGCRTKQGHIETQTNKKQMTQAELDEDCLRKIVRMRGKIEALYLEIIMARERRDMLMQEAVYRGIKRAGSYVLRRKLRHDGKPYYTVDDVNKLMGDEL